MQARFLLSAASAEQFPQTGSPEIALVGRSNVGKSSLINALTKQKLARTSAAPGKTRLVNYYLIDFGRRPSGSGRLAAGSGVPAPGSGMYLVDLPGYGYARGGPQSVEAFETLTRDYFELASTSRRVAGVLHLIDARHPDLPHDAAAFEWLMDRQLPLAIVATKIDKLKRAEQQKTVSGMQTKYGVPVLAESTLSGAGLDEIWKVLRQWVAGA